MGDETTDAFRPSLTDKGLLEEIEGVLSERLPLYKAAMDFSVDTDTMDINEICQVIMDRLKDMGDM